MKQNQKREFLRLSALFLFTMVLPKDVLKAAESLVGQTQSVGSPGNFHAIYSNPQLRNEFKKFLENVFHLYPEDKFHSLISETTQKLRSDKLVYNELLNQIPEIKPFLSEVFYALPALRKQKAEMAQQTVELLGERKSIEGYIEIGTPGRYVNSIEEKVNVKGRVLLVHDWEPGMNPQDIAERGQLRKVGEYMPLADYDRWSLTKVPKQSAEVITNFIGIHHSPPEKLAGFISSIYDSLKPGGIFILRDHDAHQPEMQSMVALAHDVFNAGLGVSWQKNEAEIRHFKSLAEIKSYLTQFRFRYEGKDLYQQGDPTKNALMKFVKV